MHASSPLGAMMPYAWRRSRASSRPASCSETGAAPPAAADSAACAAAAVSGAGVPSATLATSAASACSLAWAPACTSHTCRQLRSKHVPTTDKLAWPKPQFARADSMHALQRCCSAALTCIRCCCQSQGADLRQEAKCCLLLASKVQPGCCCKRPGGRRQTGPPSVSQGKPHADTLAAGTSATLHSKRQPMDVGGLNGITCRWSQSASLAWRGLLRHMPGSKMPPARTCCTARTAHLQYSSPTCAEGSMLSVPQQ